MPYYIRGVLGEGVRLRNEILIEIKPMNHHFNRNILNKQFALNNYLKKHPLIIMIMIILIIYNIL